MRRDPDRLNRVLLSLVGLALVALAVWGLGRGAGWFDSDHPDQPLLLDGVRGDVARNTEWFWPVAAGVGALVALAGLLWLRAQFHLPRPASTNLVLQRPSGTTRVDGAGMAQALEDDVVSSVQGVHKASARVLGDPEDSDIDLRVDVADHADLAAVRHQIEADVLPRFTRAAGLGRATTYLDVRLEAAS